MDANNLRIGFIGAGFVANFHIAAMKSVRGVELAGIYALDRAEKLACSAKENGVGEPKIFTGGNAIKDLCEAVDVVCIFTPNYTRVQIMEQIVDAVTKGGAELKGIIVEKPLARNVAEASKIVLAVDGIGVPTAYFENQIHMPAIIKARQQLSAVEKTMGSPHLARTAEEHGGPHEPWFWDPVQQGGGVWCDMGCHSVAVGMYMVTPSGRSPNHLIPVSVCANMGLLNWGKPSGRRKLQEMGVDYDKTPAEDYANVAITFRDSETENLCLVQATDSWMYVAPGLRLLMEVMGTGYSYTVNSLESPVSIFISDAAAEAVCDAEAALEKSQASRGALVLQPNEADLYGYVGEWLDAVNAFRNDRDALLDFRYGLLITRLVMAGYMSFESGKVVDLTDPGVVAKLESYVPLIQQGKGSEVLRISF